MNDKIREIRKRLNLTQHEFAARFPVKQSTVSRWENGDMTPMTQAVPRLLMMAQEARVPLSLDDFMSYTRRRRQDAAA